MLSADHLDCVTALPHHGGMDVAVVVERVRVIAAIRADTAAGRCDREAALTEVRRPRAWVDASEADLATGLAAEVSLERVGGLVNVAAHATREPAWPVRSPDRRAAVGEVGRHSGGVVR